MIPTKFFLFGIVGGVGVIVNSVILYLLVQAGMHYAAASAIATEAAILSNFTGNNLFTFRKNKNGKSIVKKFISFQTISLLSIVGTVSILTVLVTLLGETLLLIWNVIAISIMFVVNFFLNLRFTWTPSPAAEKTLASLLVLFLLVGFVVSDVTAQDADDDEDDEKEEKKEEKKEKKEEEKENRENSVIITLPDNVSDITQIIDLQQNSSNETSSNETTEEGQTPAQLVITTNPSGADIYINNMLLGTSPLSTPSPQNTVTIIAEYPEYEPNTTSIEPNTTLVHLILTQNNTANTTQNETIPPNSTNNSSNSTNSTGNTPDTGSGIFVSSNTNLTQQSSHYHMYVTNSALFTVGLNESAPIAWQVSNQSILEEASDTSSFVWTPDVLFTTEITPTTIVATVNGQSRVWNVYVEYIVNPYFSAPDGQADVSGSAQTKVNVITNNAVITPDRVTALIEGATSRNIELQKEFTFNSETYWSSNITAENGNNYLRAVTLYNNDTNSTHTYDFADARAHYRTPPQSASNSDNSDNSDDDDDSGSGGSFGISRINKPKLVYAVFAHDTMNATQTQTLTLDANIPRGEIDAINATIRTPSDTNMVKELELMQGSANYGTWNTSFNVIQLGTYTLDSVTITSGQTSETIPVQSVSFYLGADVSLVEAQLELVYATLNESRVKNGSAVELLLDAKDTSGIHNITADVTSNRNYSATIPLTLVAGNNQYGTWRGEIRANSPDTTYTIESLTMTDENESKVFPLENRQFYVESPPNSLTGNVANTAGQIRDWSFNALRKAPLFPTMLGFLVMVLLIAMIVTGKGIGDLTKKFYR